MENSREKKKQSDRRICLKMADIIIFKLLKIHRSTTPVTEKKEYTKQIHKHRDTHRKGVATTIRRRRATRE